MVAVKRFINGICLNDFEYLLDGYDGDIMKFDDEEAARKFLINAGATEEDMEWLDFEEVE